MSSHCHAASSRATGGHSAAARFLPPEFCTVYDRAPKSLSERTLELLSQYAWPGNIRELRNLVERLVLLSRADRVEPMDLPSRSVELPETTTLKSPCRWTSL